MSRKKDIEKSFKMALDHKFLLSYDFDRLEIVLNPLYRKLFDSRFEKTNDFANSVFDSVKSFDVSISKDDRSDIVTVITHHLVTNNPDLQNKFNQEFAEVRKSPHLSFQEKHR